MRAAILQGPGTVTIEQVPDPTVVTPADAVVQIKVLARP